MKQKWRGTKLKAGLMEKEMDDRKNSSRKGFKNRTSAADLNQQSSFGFSGATSVYALLDSCQKVKGAS